MAKFLVFKKNVAWDVTFKNQLVFNDETERNNWINDNLHEGWVEQLNQSKNTKFLITENLTQSIEIAINIDDILGKNYLVIMQNNKLSFWLITNIQNNESNNNFTLSLQKDLLMTYGQNLLNFKYFKATKTHLPDLNYLNETVDVGARVVKNIKTFPRKEDNEVYNQLREKAWLIVFEKVTTENDYIRKISNNTDYKEPFKIYIAPLSPLTVKDKLSVEVNLFYNENATTYQISDRLDDIIAKYGFAIDLDKTKTLNVYYRYQSEGEDLVSKSIAITDYDLLNSGIILFPLGGNRDVAEEATRQVNEKGYYNNDIVFNVQEDLNYVPLKIIFNNGILEIHLLLINEMLQYFPKAKYANNAYYANLQQSLKNSHYGLYANINGIDYEYFLSFYKFTQVMQNTWNADFLFNYLESPDNAAIIGAKVTNYCPFETYQQTGTVDLSQINNLSYEDNDKIFRLVNLNYDFLHDKNTYALKFTESKLQLLDGINKYSLVIENQIQFNLRPEFITQNQTIEILHYASFTPDWEERFKFINNDYIDLTNDDNSFINNRTFIKGTDALELEKVNNPVTTKLQWYKPLTNPLNFLNRAGIVSAFFQTGSTFFNRRNKKKQPDDFNGSGDINGDLIFNANSTNISLVEWFYPSLEREGIIKDIERQGIEGEFYLNTIYQYQRDVFNYIRIEDLNESNTLQFPTISHEESDYWNQILQNGTTLWWDFNNFLNYEVANNLKTTA